MKILQTYQEQGRLESFRMERDQIASYIKSAFQDLEEPKITFKVSDKAAYLFAYTAMLKIGRAVLFLKGYRPKGRAQHETVVEASGAILGPEFKTMTEHFDRMRTKRNKMIYDVSGLLSHQETEEAFHTAQCYLDRVRMFIETVDPQLKLKL